MSNQQTPDPEAQSLTDLEQPLHELQPEEAEDVAGGMQLRAKRSEADATDTTTESISINFTKIEF